MARTSGSQSAVTGPRIHATALRLFAEQGYAAVSMRQIAAEVGVQAGALYAYTTGKQALLFDLLRAASTDLSAAWEAAPKGSGSVAHLEAFARVEIGFRIDHPWAARLASSELRALAPDSLAAILTLRQRHEAALEAILRTGQAAGVFRIAEPRITALALLAMWSGVAFGYTDGIRPNRERVERIGWNLTRKAVGA